MLKFDTEIILTGIEQRRSKEGKDYTMINYLNPNGQSFGTIADCSIPSDLQQLDKVYVTFQVVTGRYMQLRTISIVKA